MHRNFLRILPFATLVALSTACSDATPMGQVTLQLTSRARMTTASRPQLAVTSAAQVTVELGGDQIVLNQVAIVLRKIRLDGAATASCPEGDDGDAECGSIWFGPELFDVPLGETPEPTFTSLVPVGSYSRMKFQIHKPSNANEDTAFLLEHPDFEDTSILVSGSYNGVPFTYKTDLTEVEDVPLEEPLEIGDGAVLLLTLHVDIAEWFVNEEGTELINPAEAVNGQPYESQVKQNIHQSFRAYED